MADPRPREATPRAQLLLLRFNFMSLDNFAFTKRLPQIYVLVALFVTTLLSVLTPPFFTPDETAHSLRALQVSRGTLICRPNQAGVGGMTDVGILKVTSYMDSLEGDIVSRYPKASTRPHGRVRKDEFDEVRDVRWNGSDRFAQFPNTAIYAPALYLPQAIGWKIARSLNLTIVQGLTLSRLLVSISAIALGWFALRCHPPAQPLMFVLLLLPTVLNLNASDSQDGLMLGCAALASSLVFQAVHAQRALLRVK